MVLPTMVYMELLLQEQRNSMGKYNKSNKNNIFKEEPEISVSEHTVVKNGRKMKMVILMILKLAKEFTKK